ncbi:hypothetical protein ACJW30_08G016000 [Castanea mollissima]
MVVVEENKGTSMAMGPERSKALHNFTLPCLKWGNQRYLRCMKPGPDGGGEVPTEAMVDRRSPATIAESSSTGTRRKESERRRKKDWKSGIENEGIDAVREKLLFDLKTATDKMKDAIFRKEEEQEREEEEEEEEEEEQEEEIEEEDDEAEIGEKLAPPSSAVEARPWNLRTRRAACKAPIGPKGLRIDERKVNCLPLRSENNNNGGVSVKSPRLKKEKEKQRTKLIVPLGKKEVEEDFMEMIGQRPARRPKKRPRIVQKQIDTLFPGMWLMDITVDSYKVPESADNGKR